MEEFGKESARTGPAESNSQRLSKTRTCQMGEVEAKAGGRRLSHSAGATLMEEKRSTASPAESLGRQGDSAKNPKRHTKVKDNADAIANEIAKAGPAVAEGSSSPSHPGDARSASLGEETSW